MIDPADNALALCQLAEVNLDLEALGARADSLIEDHENMMRELVSLRSAHGLTQECVAERMGVSQPMVSQIERYDANPTLDTVRRYAMAVGARLETRVLDDESSQADHWFDV